LLITLVFGHGLNVVEEKIEEEDRRELLVVASVAIAACISGVVGGIVGAVSGKGIDACGGRRDKTIVIIHDKRTGEFKQQGRRRLLGGDVKAAAGDTNAASDTNAMGVLFDSNGVTCPSDAEHVVVALQKNSNDDGSHFFTIPNQYFDDKAFEKLPARQKELFQKLTPKERWKMAISQVIAKIRNKKATGVQGGAVLQKSANPMKSLEYVQIASQNVKSSGTMQYLPHFSLAVALSLLGIFAYRKNNEQKTFIHEELLDPTL